MTDGRGEDKQRYRRESGGPDNAVRNDEMVEVDERDGNKRSKEQQVRGKHPVTAKMERRTREQRGGPELDKGIAHRDSRPAVPAPPTQQQPRHDRDVVPRSDWFVAAGTVRRGTDNRFLPRHAPDDDVQK